MAFGHRLAWGAAWTVACATSVLAASALLDLPLRPGFLDSGPAAPVASPTAGAAAAPPAEIVAVLPPDVAPFNPATLAVSDARIVKDEPRPLDTALLFVDTVRQPTSFALRPAFGPAEAWDRLEPPAIASRPGSAEPPAAAENAAEADALATVLPPLRPSLESEALATAALVPLPPPADRTFAAPAVEDPAEVQAAAVPTPPVTAAPRPGGLFGGLFGQQEPSQADDAFSRPLQSGLASWYGPGFHGRRTASGERFDQGDLTAAHRSLPFGTRVRVIDETTGRSVVVRINDRGPFKRGRVIDLSKSAARELGMGGLAHVKLVSAQ